MARAENVLASTLSAGMHRHVVCLSLCLTMILTLVILVILVIQTIRVAAVILIARNGCGTEAEAVAHVLV